MVNAAQNVYRYDSDLYGRLTVQSYLAFLLGIITLNSSLLASSSLRGRRENVV